MNDGKSYVIGAPEFVLRGQFAQYQEQIATYSSKGYRVLVFAQYEGTLDRKPLTEPVLPLCFVMLANPIRKGAKETFTYFAENDVDIKVISGDNPLTVSVIAAEAGIVGAERLSMHRLERKRRLLSRGGRVYGIRPCDPEPEADAGTGTERT